MARVEDQDGIKFKVEEDRIRKVILKLARGHALFELNEPQFDEPSEMSVRTSPTMADWERSDSERAPVATVWPEVGSRSMQRLVASFGDGCEWIDVQPGRYRYLAHVGDGVLIRIVLSEYLACEVRWTKT
jgi:hypothetical protein